MLLVETKSVTVEGEPAQMFELTYVNKLLKLCQIVMNHIYMQDFIMNSSFTQTRDSNAELFHKFYSGKERRTDNDGVWEAEINVYYRDNGILGYTWSNSTEININALEIPMNKNPLAISARVGNLVHEYCHLVGMKHSPKWKFWLWKRRKKSAPYKIGYEARGIARFLLEQGEVVWKDL
jgi:hypothetical protein